MKNQFKLSHFTIPTIILCLYIRFSNGHRDSAYMSNPNDGFTTRSDWMRHLPDDTQLSQLAVPGTHGSASYLGQPTNDAVEDFNRKFYVIPPFSYILRPVVRSFSANQALNIEQQLDIGIRAFDVRILYTNDEFVIMQGGKNLHIMFKDFLNQVTSFLSQYPTETLLIAITIEKQFGNNIKSANGKLNEYLKENTVSNYYLKNKNAQIKLGETRGKFVILARDTMFNKNALYFYGSRFKVMDQNRLYTMWEMYKKWTRVKNNLELARNGDKNMFYVTYLTGYGGIYPYFVASGHFCMGSSSSRVLTGLTTPLFAYTFPDFPRVGCIFGVCNIAFEGINVLTKNKLESYNKDIGTQPRTVGIIMADFPGDSLIGSIIENNYGLLKS